MANLPECIKCGGYINWGWCLCYDHTKELYQWVSDVLDEGLTDKLMDDGVKHLRNYNCLLIYEEQQYERDIEQREMNYPHPREEIEK